MTPEQRIFWDTLKCDAHWFAHDRARILSSLDAELFHKTVDDLLMQMSNNLSAAEIASVIKTWLTVYKLPLAPIRLGLGFEKVTGKIGQYVLTQAREIKSVEVV